LRLDVFEGPLDILLHLVRDQKLDINDIPIAKITEQYLAYLDLMQALNLEVAGEFLVMASTLVHIKSKSLLPRHGDEEEEEDPEVMRQELSRRLIEYERFKEAAARLGDRPVLGRDVFVRDFLGEEIPGEELVITELSMADLITAFKDALARMPADAAQEFFVERLTIADAIAFLLDDAQSSYVTGEVLAVDGGFRGAQLRGRIAEPARDARLQHVGAGVLAAGRRQPAHGRDGFEGLGGTPSPHETVGELQAVLPVVRIEGPKRAVGLTRAVPVAAQLVKASLDA